VARESPHVNLRLSRTGLTRLHPGYAGYCTRTKGTLKNLDLRTHGSIEHLESLIKTILRETEVYE